MKKGWFDNSIFGKVIVGFSVAACMAALMGMYNFAVSLPENIKSGPQALEQCQKINIRLDTIQAKEATQNRKIENVLRDVQDAKEDISETKLMVNKLLDLELNKNRH